MIMIHIFLQETEIADEASMRGADKKEFSSAQSTVDIVPKSNNKSKKKKKKKSKESSTSRADKVDNSLDEDLDALSLDVSSSGHQSGPTKAKVENAKVRNNVVKQHVPSILQVDPKCLNPENELRRIFGSKVVKSFERSNQSGSSRQVRGARRGTHHIRKTILVSPSDQWPRWDQSFSMEFLETKGGYSYFRFNSIYLSSYLLVGITDSAPFFMIILQKKIWFESRCYQCLLVIH